MGQRSQGWMLHFCKIVVFDGLTLSLKGLVESEVNKNLALLLFFMYFYLLIYSFL